jgi:hypothetical protein
MATRNDNTAILFLILTRAKAAEQLNVRALLLAGSEDAKIARPSNPAGLE